MARATWYSRFSQGFARTSGRPLAFTLAAGLTVLWILTGPIFGFSDTWQLVMNTISSIVTFLMVFIIQNTQNRQTEALQIKIDELIRATQDAHKALLDLEELDEEAIEQFKQRYLALARAARTAREDRKT